MEDLVNVISLATGIQKAQIQLYTLNSDPSFDLADYYLPDADIFTGLYYVKGRSELRVFTLDGKTREYADLIIFGAKDVPILTTKVLN